MRRLWLVFAQSATATLAAVFVISLIKPDLLPLRNRVVAITEAPAASNMTLTRLVGSPAIGTGYSEAAKKAIPSVVNIFTSKEVRVPSHPVLNDPIFRRYFGDQLDGGSQQQRSLGSGVIVSQQGYILTNHHVVEDADEIQVALADGRTAKARIVGADPDTDLAVLKIDLHNLPAVTFGQSDQLRVGDVVLAIGDPFGVGQTVTMGIVSALGRSRLGINQFENFIQTDAAINPGNSGGALVDISGNLVGINSAIFSQTGGSQGIGFSIPVSLARNVMEQLIRSGAVTRGWIGVEVRDLTPELADSFRLEAKRGALIAGILRNSPADRAQVKPGDVLVGINGRPVSDSVSMLNLIAELAPGREATLDVIRERQQLALKVTVGKRPRNPNS